MAEDATHQPAHNRKKAFFWIFLLPVIVTFLAIELDANFLHSTDSALGMIFMYGPLLIPAVYIGRTKATILQKVIFMALYLPALMYMILLPLTFLTFCGLHNQCG